jgi:peptidoglycan/xylan/chitin deacetylase (PgdA/CDA1 family)
MSDETRPDLPLAAQYLLNYLEQKNVHATFFVVGSRVVERPSVLVEEYMQGHEISVHTWSHRVRFLSLRSNNETDALSSR